MYKRDKVVSRLLRSRLVVHSLCLLAFVGSALSQTRQVLDAPVVNYELRVRWNATDKKVEGAPDPNKSGTKFRELKSDAIFLTKRSVFVTFERLNPLNIQATASATATDDPSYATITKLIQAITSVATTISPVLPAPPPGAAAPPATTADTCGDATQTIRKLRDSLYSNETTPEQITQKVMGWINAIEQGFDDGRSGPAAISAGMTAMRTDAKTINGLIDNANKSLEKIKGCAETLPDDDSQKVYYLTVTLTDHTQRLQQLAALKTAITDLADLLEKQYAVATKWISSPQTIPAYIISPEIGPTFAKMQSIALKIETISLKVDNNTGVISVNRQAVSSVGFTVRQYSPFVPEIGMGAVFATITPPKFGTATNASGQTIVAKVPSSSVSVNPTVLANFVCRCWSGPLVPMIQVGAAASKDVPAILTGGGLRLFGLGKGDIAIGGGAMFAWVRDLQKLKVGDIVTGTKDIEADLGYSGPRVRGYFSLQYKF